MNNEQVVLPVPFSARAFQCCKEDGRAPVRENKKQRLFCNGKNPPRDRGDLNNIESGRREAKVRFPLVKVGPAAPTEAEQRYFCKHRAWRLHSHGGARSSSKFLIPARPRLFVHSVPPTFPSLTFVMRSPPSAEPLPPLAPNNVVGPRRGVGEKNNENVVLSIPFSARAFQCCKEDGRAPVRENKKQRLFCNGKNPPP